MHKKVYLVGAGPGDRGLITVRGCNILREADVVIYDYLVDKRLLEETKEGAELICCDTLGPSTSLRAHGERSRTMGKRRYSDGFLVHNERINELVVKKAKEGKSVIRLKNGDPGIFSRTSQELEPLIKNKIEFEIVPGVTAANAASCLSGVPLTDRRHASSCVFATGHEDPSKKESLIDWEVLSKAGTIVLYMAVENLPKIVKALIRAGKKSGTPVAIIQDVSLLTQKVSRGTLGDIVEKARQKKVRPPAIIIIGKVAKFEERFNWLRKNRRILFTGLSKERYFLKGNYLHLPLIRIEPMGSYKEFDRHLKNIEGFDWIVFSSRYGVEYFFKRLKAIGYDVRILSGIKIAAIGNSTKSRLSDFGIIADLVPSVESSQGLLAEFKRSFSPSGFRMSPSRRKPLRGLKIFLPRSDISDKHLSDGFKKLGADVTTSFAYRNVMAKKLPDVDLNSFDEIMFTSPSGVRSFIKRYKKLPKGVKVNCIGDVTLREAKRCGLVD